MNILPAGWCVVSSIISFMLCWHWILMSCKRLCTGNISPPGFSEVPHIQSDLLWHVGMRQRIRNQSLIGTEHQGGKVWHPQAEVQPNAIKTGAGVMSPEKCLLVQTLMKSGGGRPANSDHTPINKVSKEFTCRKSSIFNIAIAFLFSFIRYVTAGAPFQEFCLNAFLSYFSFLNLDATWYFQRANVLLLFKENQEEAGSSVRVNNAGLM